MPTPSAPSSGQSSSPPPGFTEKTTVITTFCSVGSLLVSIWTAWFAVRKRRQGDDTPGYLEARIQALQEEVLALPTEKQLEKVRRRLGKVEKDVEHLE
jgi:hypothetical protein